MTKYGNILIVSRDERKILAKREICGDHLAFEEFGGLTKSEFVEKFITKPTGLMMQNAKYMNYDVLAFMMLCLVQFPDFIIIMDGDGVNAREFHDKDRVQLISQIEKERRVALDSSTDYVDKEEVEEESNDWRCNCKRCS